MLYSKDRKNSESEETDKAGSRRRRDTNAFPPPNPESKRVFHAPRGSKSTVEKEIESRGMTPHPRWHFLLKRSVFWSLAVASVLVGAIAYSAADYVFSDNEGLSPSAFLDTPFEIIVQGVPFIWLFIFGLFCIVTYVGLRHTRTGYKYRTAGIVLMVLVVTIGLGTLLNLFDFGQELHRYLLSNTTFYDGLIHSREDLE